MIRAPFLEPYPRPDELPRIDYVPRQPCEDFYLELVSTSGGRWRVIDLIGAPDTPPGSCDRLPAPCGRALYRLFCYHDGTTRLYRFAVEERRDFSLRPWKLQLQLDRSEPIILTR